MPSVERDITVSRPIGTVWDYLSDFRTSEQWDPPSESTVRISGDGGLATVYENTSRILGRSAQVTYTVTGFDPPRQLELRGENESLTAVDIITLTPTDPTTTRVNYHAQFTLKGAAKLAAPLLPAGLKKLADDVEDSLDKHLNAL